MNGWEVLSDGIKIGVPALVTGLVAVLVTRSARSHDLEKERRRRKQDILERSGATLDEFERRLSHEEASFRKIAFEAEKSSASPVNAAEVFMAASALADEAERRLWQLESALLYSGFSECVQAFYSYLLAAATVRDCIQKERAGIASILTDASNGARQSGSMLRGRLAEAYQSL